MSLATLEFEIPRRVVLLKKNTRMPDLTQLGVTGDPNVLDPVRVLDYNTGEFLLANAPPMTMYLDVDSDDVWRRTTSATWVKIFNDTGVEGGSGSSSDYNAHNEYTLASASPDETLHFEGGDIFMTERSEAIIFETNRDSDENAYAAASENQLFLEGMVPLTTEDGEAIGMDSADTWDGNLLDDYFGVRPWIDWINLWASEGADREDGLIMQRNYVAGVSHKRVFGAPDRHLSIVARSSFVFIKEHTHTFTVTNDSPTPWSTNARTYILLEDGYIYTLMNAARGFTFRKTINPIPGMTRWVVTNLSTGGQHAFTTDD